MCVWHPRTHTHTCTRAYGTPRVNLRATVELNARVPWRVEDVVAVRIKRSAVVVADRVAVAIGDPVEVAPEDEVAAPLVRRGWDENAHRRIRRVRCHVVAPVPAVERRRVVRFSVQVEHYIALGDSAAAHAVLEVHSMPVVAHKDVSGL